MQALQEREKDTGSVTSSLHREWRETRHTEHKGQGDHQENKRETDRTYTP